MRVELERKIYEIDPVFFRQKDLDMTQTCMCWGLECGSGWYEPIKELVQKVKMLNDQIAPLNMCIVALQIKSKWADFTCYWSVEELDPDKNIELTEDQTQMLNTVYSMMKDAVEGCEAKCSRTCEICGKSSFLKRDMLVCGSWLTVKCLDCAQKSQREAGKITNFKEGFPFLSPFVEEPVIIDGACFHTIIGAYYAMLYPEWHDVFLEMKSPSEVQAVAMTKGLCRDDDKALEAMEKVLRIRYREGRSRKMLLSTEGLEIIQSNSHHENKWGSCLCGECAGKGENRYGKLLMKIRDDLLEEERKRREQ